MLYTYEIYKRDGRKRVGDRLVEKKDIETADIASFCETLETLYPYRQGYRVEVYETMVTRRNLVTGLEYSERYDTPLALSPASDTFWSS